MGLIGLGLIVASSAPLVAAIGLVAVIPWSGELREPGAATLLHLLWILPVLWVFSIVSTGISKRLVGDRKPGLLGRSIDKFLCWLLLAAMYTVVFADEIGAAVASLVSWLLLEPMVNWLEKAGTEKDNRRELD